MKTNLEKTLALCMAIWIVVALLAAWRCHQLSAEIKWWKSLAPEIYITK